MTQRRVAEALVAFERALANAPKDKTLWRHVIWAHLYLGQRERALSRLESSPPGTVNYEFNIRLKRDELALPQ